VEEPLVDRQELTHLFLAIHDISANVEGIRALLEEDDDGEASEEDA
jgi:hypothetical protein